MYYGHPVYRVPSGYDATKRMFLDSPGANNIHPETGDMLVFSTWIGPDVPIPEEDAEKFWLEEDATVRDLIPEYLPTAEEVVRALRGPMGPPGPMGMDGLPGEPA